MSDDSPYNIHEYQEKRSKRVHRQLNHALIMFGFAGIGWMVAETPHGAMLIAAFTFAGLTSGWHAVAYRHDGLARRLKERIAGKNNLWNKKPESINE